MLGMLRARIREYKEARDAVREAAKAYIQAVKQKAENTAELLQHITEADKKYDEAANRVAYPLVFCIEIGAIRIVDPATEQSISMEDAFRKEG